MPRLHIDGQCEVAILLYHSRELPIGNALEYIDTALGSYDEGTVKCKFILNITNNCKTLLKRKALFSFLT